MAVAVMAFAQILGRLLRREAPTLTLPRLRGRECGGSGSRSFTRGGSPSPAGGGEPGWGPPRALLSDGARRVL